MIKNKKKFLISEQKLIFFDIETTGLKNYSDEIIQFAYVIVKNELTLERGTFFVKSNQKIPPRIIKLTKIDLQKYYKEAISKDLAISKIQKIINDNILVAHNAKFDIGFINNLFSLYKIPRITNIVIDTLNLSRILNPEFFSHKLENVIKEHKISYYSEKLHCALYDSEMVKKMFFHIIKQNKISSLKDLSILDNGYKKIIKKYS